MKDVTQKTLCRTCEEELDEGAAVCACGTPTPLASFKQRAEWEAKQWRAHKTRARGA